jgi:hypothetical protein
VMPSITNASREHYSQRIILIRDIAALTNNLIRYVCALIFARGKVNGEGFYLEFKKTDFFGCINSIVNWFVNVSF